MQIDRLNYLQFPPDHRSSAGADDVVTTETARTTDAAALPRVPAVHQEPQAPAGVLVRLGQDARSAGVYSRGRANGVQDTDEVDRTGMQQRHQEALARSRPALQSLALDPAGVLVAKPRSAFSTQESDFVALAVSAMRDFRDSAERTRAAQGSSDADIGPVGGLRGGLAHLAARLRALA